MVKFLSTSWKIAVKQPTNLRLWGALWKARLPKAPHVTLFVPPYGTNYQLESNDKAGKPHETHCPLDFELKQY